MSDMDTVRTQTIGEEFGRALQASAREGARYRVLLYADAANLLELADAAERAAAAAQRVAGLARLVAALQPSEQRTPLPVRLAAI